MNVTLVNKSHVPTKELQGIIDWLSSCYGDVKRPVTMTVMSRDGRWGVWGKAYFPVERKSSRVIKKGEYSIRIFVGRHDRPSGYPYTYTYKKRAGSCTIYSHHERLLNVIAHEMRHVEQFAAAAVRREEMCVRNDQKPAWARDPHLRIEAFCLFFRRYEKMVGVFHSGSCEVDAELVAIPLTIAYQESVTCSIPPTKLAVAA